MTHNQDANCTVPLGTEGDGFVMIGHRDPRRYRDLLPFVPANQEPTCKVWPGIEDDVRELERFLK